MSYFYDNGIPGTDAETSAEDDYYEDLRQQMLARITKLLSLLESRAEIDEDQWNAENRLLAIQEMDRLYQLVGLPSCDSLTDFENQEDA